MTVEYPPDERAAMWLMRILNEHGPQTISQLRERVPFGRDRLLETLKTLQENGRISRTQNTVWPAGSESLKVPDGPGSESLKVPETPDLVPPHAPPPNKNQVFSSGRAKGDPFVVVCTWKQAQPDGRLCDFAHQTFFANRPDAFAHFKAHCRDAHPARDWDVALMDRVSGEAIETWSTIPYEPIPYEVGKQGLNAFIQSQLAGKKP